MSFGSKAGRPRGQKALVIDRNRALNLAMNAVLITLVSNGLHVRERLRYRGLR